MSSNSVWLICLIALVGLQFFILLVAMCFYIYGSCYRQNLRRRNNKLEQYFINVVQLMKVLEGNILLKEEHLDTMTHMSKNDEFAEHSLLILKLLEDKYPGCPLLKNRINENRIILGSDLHQIKNTNKIVRIIRWNWKYIVWIVPMLLSSAFIYLITITSKDIFEKAIKANNINPSWKNTGLIMLIGLAVGYTWSTFYVKFKQCEKALVELMNTNPKDYVDK